MSASIYYFTGTGNSLHAARTVAERLGDCKVINIAREKSPGVIKDNSDTVGIVFPVYYMNMPVIVQDFVKKLKLKPDAYVFGIATSGGGPGVSLRTLEKLLTANGGHLSAGLELTTVDNAYVGVNVVTPLEEREGLLKAADAILDTFIESLKKKEKQVNIGGNALAGIGLGSLMSTFGTHIYRLPRKFHATDKCTGCGICQKVCPVGNVRQADKTVTWGNNCTQCLACFHWCPQTAIEIGNGTKNIVRYHHPAVKVNDIIK